MAQESRVSGSQVRKLIFSYGTLFGGVLGLLSLSTPSYANLLSGIESSEESVQSNSQGATLKVGFQMAVQSPGQGGAYDSDGDPIDESRLFGSRARYSFTTKTSGLTIVHPSGLGGWPGQFPPDGGDGNDGNDGNARDDDDDGGDDLFGDIIIPEATVQGNVADASDLLTEVNFKSYRYDGLLKSL